MEARWNGVHYSNVYSKTFLPLRYLLAPARSISRIVWVQLVGVIVLCSRMSRAVGVQLVGVMVHVALRGTTLRHLWFPGNRKRERVRLMEL